ncbi:MAG: M1 family metallopeptidase, partial [Planctomycetota bacterium]|nr:M1 family metallopeptidase [Planctomycetota bacterium]
MKRLLLCSLALLTACQVLPAPSPTARFGGRATVHNPRLSDFDVEHYSIELALDPRARSFAARCTVRLHASIDGLESVALDLAGLEVNAVHDGALRELSYEHSGGQLDIALAQPLAQGDFIELAVDYAGLPQKGLWFAGEREGAATHVFTQGECEDSHWWFPCWDFPSDRATSEVRVTMPAHWTSVAAGELIDSTKTEVTRTDHWRMPTPHPAYLTTLVAGEFVVQEGEWDGIPLLFLAAEEDQHLMEAAFAETDEALAFLSEVTGKRYPYSKYSQACVDNFPFGGMENISATTLTSNVLTDERGRRDRAATGLVVHEAAHQWFGDLMTCRDWSHIWLNEGFATYMTLLYFERTRGVDEYRARLRQAQQAYMAGDQGANRRPTVHNIYRDPMDLFFGGHAYPGGAARLHLLREVMGDEAFFAGIRRYVGDNIGRSVTTADLRRALEQSSGQDLGEFFDQWFHSQGYPEMSVRWEWDGRNRQVALCVEQTQEAGDGTPRVFKVPVDVEVRTASGVSNHRLQLDRRRHRFVLPCDERPTWVRFDKYGSLPASVDREKRTSEWLAIAGQDDDVGGRVMAVEVLGRVLAGSKDDDLADLIRGELLNRLSGDSSRFVRQAAVQALAAGGGTRAAEVLCAVAREDAEAQVRVAALSALEGFVGLRGDGLGDEALAHLAETVYEDGFSWQTMIAAASLRRASSPEGAFFWLGDRLHEPSPHSVLQAGLLRVLSRCDDPGVLPQLRLWAGDHDAAPETRVVAVQALGQVGRGQRE